jgi:hypothetical protein
LDDDLLGPLSFLFQALSALPRQGVLGAVIMSRLPITTPKRGLRGKGARRVLAGRNHQTRVTGQRKCVPLKIKEYYSTGGIADSLPAKNLENSSKLLIMRGMQF